jgi:endoglucanase
MSLDFRATDGVIKCNGQRVYIKGANWFGLENNTFSLHGLWAVSFESLVDFLEDNKFNAVRLPISVECVEKWSSIQPQAVNSNYNPNLINITVEEFIDRVITR